MYQAKILIFAPQVNIDGHGSMSQFLRASRNVVRKKFSENEILIVDKDLLSSYLWFGVPFMARFYIFMIPFAIFHIFGRKYTFLAISQEYVLPFNFGRQLCILHDIIQYFYGINFFKSFIYKKVLKFSLPKFKKIYFVSEATKNISKKIYKKDCCWFGPIYVPLQLSRESKNCIKKEIDFIWIGAVSQHKRLDLFLNALSVLEKNAVLLIPKKSAEIVKLKLKTLGLDSSVSIFSDMPTWKLSELLNGTKTLVSTSRIEGFGMPILEALHSGCNVVCASNPINNELFKAHAIFFQKNNFDDLCNAMRKSLGNSSTNNIDLSRYIYAYNSFLNDLEITIN